MEITPGRPDLSRLFGERGAPGRRGRLADDNGGENRKVNAGATGEKGIDSRIFVPVLFSRETFRAKRLGALLLKPLFRRRNSPPPHVRFAAPARPPFSATVRLSGVKMEGFWPENEPKLHKNAEIFHGFAGRFTTID